MEEEKTKSESIQKPKRFQPRSQTWQHSDRSTLPYSDANLTAALSGVTDPIIVLQRIGANVEDALLS
jgi:hypothetical protein